MQKVNKNGQNQTKKQKFSLMSRSWKGNKREKYVLLFMVTWYMYCTSNSCLQSVCITMLRI